jgi:hypothetical protein
VIVQAGTSGSINVFSWNASADVIIDINGYYGPTGSLPFGVANTFISPVVASPTYLYPLAVFLPTGGACLVTSQAQFQMTGTQTSANIFLRIAVKHGVAADTNDSHYGHYFGPMPGFVSPDMSRTSLITVNPAESTQFGCYISGVDAGDLVAGDLTLFCQTSYLCF